MSPPSPPDLHATRQSIAQQRSRATEHMAQSLAIAQSSACTHAFLSLDPLAAHHAAHHAASANPSAPLAGLAISVKDLYDIAGQTSRAGSAVLADAPTATQDSVAVARLRAAGGAIMGRTNMVEFAFSGVGTNPHYGTPVNPCDSVVPRIPGGSSSGAAVSVATGAAFVGLGSDTGGSIRIPAALCGLVGFKPTARLVSTMGTVPLSSTLDTVCALTRSVRDAVTAYEVLSASSVPASEKPLAQYRLAVAKTTMQDSLDTTVGRAFERTLAQLAAAGALIEEVDVHDIAHLSTIQSRGGFAAPEALAWQRERGLWPARRAAYDPRVAQRIALAQDMSAADYVALVTARQEWIARMHAALQGFDAVLSPTVPIVAPPIASVAPGAAQDAEFFRVNGLLLRNTSVVNLLDGCAISLPCHDAGELPVGLMVWHAALHDHTVLQLAGQIESTLAGR